MSGSAGASVSEQFTIELFVELELTYNSNAMVGLRSFVPDRAGSVEYEVRP